MRKNQESFFFFALEVNVCRYNGDPRSAFPLCRMYRGGNKRHRFPSRTWERAVRGEEEGGRWFWVLQMVRKTFASTVVNRGKVLCAGRGKHLDVQRADLKERGFLVHTSARGAQADCRGLLGMEV